MNACHFRPGAWRRKPGPYQSVWCPCTSPPRSCVPDVRMYFKPTSQGVPLSHLSDHHSNIHSFWPVARFNCFSSRCTSNRSALFAKVIMLNKIYDSHPEHVSIANLVNMLGDRRVFTCSRSRDRNSWLVLPFHKGLEFSRLAKALSDDAELWTASDFARFRPLLSWKLTTVSLCEWLQKDCKGKTYRLSLRRAR